jgi:exosortase
MRSARALPIFAVVVAFLVLYADAFRTLVRDWTNDDNYSHGFLIIPIALYLVWERRGELAKAPLQPSALGLVLIVASLLATVAGRLGAELFLSRAPMIGVLAGTVLYGLGWAHLRILAFPIAFLILMVPLPSLIFNQIAFPLQLLASRTGETGLEALQIPVLREGNIIMLANTTLEVAEACSGIRSLVSLLTLGIVYGYFMDSRLWVRVLLALSTVPIAVFANGVRVAGTGVAAHYYGPEAADGFLHTFSGWLVFLAAFVVLFGLQMIIARVFPERARRRPVPRLMEEPRASLGA